MKGRTPSASEKAWHSALCVEIGCIACRKDGGYNPIVSVHHCDGRTKPHAHWFSLPLCAGHHQDGTGRQGLIAIHPWKARFERRYGTQIELLAECVDILESVGRVVPAEVYDFLIERGVLA